MAEILIFDTDILIDYLLGNLDVKTFFAKFPKANRYTTVISEMEIYHGARNKQELNIFKRFFHPEVNTHPEHKHAEDEIIGVVRPDIENIISEKKVYQAVKAECDSCSYKGRCCSSMKGEPRTINTNSPGSLRFSFY